jgi:NADH dehydrogenase [ubiquinone] 1 alpha subcomplex assembly factor 5
MGESNAIRHRKIHLNRDTLIAASTIYDQLYGKIKKDRKYIPATFQIIYMIGWKPDESQPKAIKPGTGEISLKDIYRIDKIIKERTKINSINKK